VRLDHPDHHVDAGAFPLVGLDQHRVGLADAGRGAEEDLELGPMCVFFLGPNAGQQLIGTGTLAHAGSMTIACGFRGRVRPAATPPTDAAYASTRWPRRRARARTRS